MPGRGHKDQDMAESHETSSEGPGTGSRDHSGPIRGQDPGHVISLPIRGTRLTRSEGEILGDSGRADRMIWMRTGDIPLLYLPPMTKLIHFNQKPDVAGPFQQLKMPSGI